MDEMGLWNDVRNCFINRGVHAERLTDRFSVGVSDLIYCPPGGIMGWCELKVIQVIKSKVRITPEQVAFLYRFSQKGSPAWVLVKINNTSERRFVLFGHNRLPEASTARPRIADWNELFQPNYVKLGVSPWLHRFDKVAACVDYMLDS